MTTQLLDDVPANWKMETDIRFGVLTETRRDAQQVQIELMQEIDAILESPKFQGVEIEVCESRFLSAETLQEDLVQ